MYDISQHTVRMDSRFALQGLITKAQKPTILCSFQLIAFAQHSITPVRGRNIFLFFYFQEHTERSRLLIGNDLFLISFFLSRTQVSDGNLSKYVHKQHHPPRNLDVHVECVCGHKARRSKCTVNTRDVAAEKLRRT